MPDALLDKLRAAVGPANVLTGIELSPYVVDGRTPDAAVFPGSIEEVAAVMAMASEVGRSVTPWGGGTAASVGMPAARAGLVIGLRRLARLVDHEPGDLTATVEAGMTVGAFQAALGSRGQWLSLDPDDAGRATVGGVLATNACGPRRHLYGTARDLLIGVTVVTADGSVVKGGGKVVKNVAGYDLPKLYIGSYGTLGVIVEATVKLRPRPEQEDLVSVRFDRLKDAGAAVRAVASSDLIPNAVELFDGAAAAGAGLAAGSAAPGGTLVVGFDGVPEQVAWQRAELERLTAPLAGRDVRPLEASTWTRLSGAARAAFPTPAAVMALAVLPSQVAGHDGAGRDHRARARSRERVGGSRGCRRRACRARRRSESQGSRGAGGRPHRMARDGPRRRRPRESRVGPARGEVAGAGVGRSRRGRPDHGADQGAARSAKHPESRPLRRRDLRLIEEKD